MTESFITLPPDSTGKKLRTNDRGTPGHDQFVRLAENPTYSVVGRVAAVNVRSALAFAQPANADKQWLTLHHLATAARTISVTYVGLILVDVSAATVLDFDIRRITTAPATGAPAITPKPHSYANAATEATALALPTTAGTVDVAAESYGLSEFDSGILAPPTAPPAQNLGRFDLWPNATHGEEAQPLTIRAGVLEGIALIVRSTLAATVTGIPIIRYNEESP